MSEIDMGNHEGQLIVGGEMSVKSELEEQEEAKGIVLELLRSAEAPLRIEDLLRKVSESARSISSRAVRRAIWFLVDAGEAEYTQDRRVTSSKLEEQGDE